MAIKTKTEKKPVIKKITKRNNVDLLVTEKLGEPQEYPECGDTPHAPLDMGFGEQSSLNVVPVDMVFGEQSSMNEVQVVLEEGANGPAEPAEVSAELVSSSDEELLEKPKKTRVLKEGKPRVNEVGEYLNPLTNRYVKVGTTLYKKLIRDGMICVVPV